MLRYKGREAQLLQDLKTKYKVLRRTCRGIQLPNTLGTAGVCFTVFLGTIDI